MAPENRRVGMVFQDNALFPHLTVNENVGFGIAGLASDQRQHNINQLLQRIDLADMGQRYPHELSGGQQQRVALARALAPNPDLILMDEPFSNLDTETRERLGYEVRDILKEQETTCVLVTHDQNDAFALSDRVGVMRDGRILQWDTPYNLYHEPASRFVADFIGDGVFLPGTLIEPGAVETGLGVIRSGVDYKGAPGDVMDVLIRPDDIVPDDDRMLVATVVRKAFKGAEILYTLRVSDGNHVLSLFPSHSDYQLGETVGIRLQADHLVAFPQVGHAG
jgi:iron(III) transport system ATP-binding protein